MGNYASCTLSVHTAGGASRVFLPDSGIRSVGTAKSAAELMLEFPGHFLANSASLRIGSRFSPLSADEDLEPGNVYTMFPMHRLSSKVIAADVAPLLVAVAVAGRKIVRCQRKAMPSSAVAPLPAEVEAGIGRRSSLCRSRRRVLETIAEETCAF